MPAPLLLADDDAAVVEGYLTAMRAADRRTGSSTTRAARTCQTKIRRGGGWDSLSSADRLDAVRKAPSFTSWLMVTGQIIVDAAVAQRTDLRLGNAGPTVLPARAPLVHRNLLSAWHFRRGNAESQWNTLWQDRRDHRRDGSNGHRRRLQHRPRRHDRRLRPSRATELGPHHGRDLPPAAADAVPRRPPHHAESASPAPAGVGDRMGHRRAGIHRDRAPLRRAGRR